MIKETKSAVLALLMIVSVVAIAFTAAGMATNTANQDVAIQSTHASVTIADQDTDGASVVVEQASFDDDDFVIVIHDEDGDIVGSSEVYDAGDEAVDVEVTLDTPIRTTQSVTAMLHYADSDSAYGEAITVDDETVDDDAHLTVTTTDSTVAALEDYEDVEVALDDGYLNTYNFVEHPDQGGMGVHFINPDLLNDGELHPHEPEALFYTINDETGEWELLGAEWILSANQAEDTPTLLNESFHYTDNQAALGEEGYELHAWLFEENSAGEFAAFNPNVETPELVTIEDQEGDGTSVTVDRIAYNGYDAEIDVGVYDNDGNTLGFTTIEAGIHEDVTVDFFDNATLEQSEDVNVLIYHTAEGEEFQPVAWDAGYDNATYSVDGGSSVADYANEDGEVDTDGLRAAIDDWRNGDIDTNLLRDVIDAWRSGEPVE